MARVVLKFIFLQGELVVKAYREFLNVDNLFINFFKAKASGSVSFQVHVVGLIKVMMSTGKPSVLKS